MRFFTIFRGRWIVCLSFGLVAVFGITACGDSGASEEELNQAKREGAAHAREQARIKQIQREIRRLRRGNGTTPSSPSGSGTTASSEGSSGCGGELSVGPNTTCPFAVNVERAYFEEIGSGSGTVVAYSPVTGKTYSMYCTAGTPHVCTGGNDASVYFP